MEIIFGTDGWRGLLDREIDHDAVMTVAQAFADHAIAHAVTPLVIIGYDGRRHSRSFAEAFTAVLNGNGIRTILSDRIVPTPVVSFSVHDRKADHGVMITASHNPPEYNGIKFKTALGGPFSTEETRLVEARLGMSPIRRSDKPQHTEDLTERYWDHLTALVDLPLIARSGIVPLIDSMNGAGGTLLQGWLERCGIPARTIDGNPEERFGGRSPEPIERNLLPLSRALQQGSYSLGVATDGDADRVGVMLEDGTWLSSQETILLLAGHLKRNKRMPGDIIKTSSVTDMVRSLFERDECRVHDVQVGFKYISERMVETGAAFGAEESGGYGFKGHIPERDGILSAVLMMELLAASPFRRLSELVAAHRKEFGRIWYDRIDHPYHRQDRLSLLPRIGDAPPPAISGFPVQSVSRFLSSRGVVNGVKLMLDGRARWLLLRSSETEPLIRIYAEGNSDSEVQRLLQAGMQLIETTSASHHP